MTTTETSSPTGYTLVTINPNELDIADNVRDDVDITDDPAFIDSIAQHGVLQAVSAVRRADQTLSVVDGQRRTLAAREVGLDSIPVLVRAETAEEKAASIERITAKVVSNDQRTDITEGQRITAVTRLLDLGLTVPTVAKKLQLRKDYTEKAGRAGRSANARRRIDERQLTLDGAAVLADLEAAAQADPWITEAIDKTLSNGYVNMCQLNNLKREVAERVAATAAAVEYTARGFTLLYDEPSTRTGDWLSLADLRTVDGTAVGVDAPEQAPHLWHVYVGDAGSIWVDKKTRQEIDEDDIDFDTEDEGDDVEPDGGLRHANTVEEVHAWDFEFFMHHDRRSGTGLELTAQAAALAGNADAEGSDLTSSQRGAAHAEAERLEGERAERRKVKALNRAGATATDARRTFLTDLLSGKTTPTNATKWIVGALADHGDVFTESKSTQRYSDIMGAPLHDAASKAASASSSRAEVLLLARVLSAFEARLTGPQDAKDYWRFTSKHYRGLAGIDSYLTFLADSGHTLSAVEQAAIGNITVDAAHDTVSGGAQDS